MAEITIQAAARELRALQGRSQQAMATALNLSMGALRNYESGAVDTPDPRPLYAYMSQAMGSGRPDLAVVFRRAFNKALGVPDDYAGHLPTEPRNNLERVLIAALLNSLRLQDRRYAKFRKPLIRTLEGPCKVLGSDLRQLQEMKQAWRDLQAECAAEGIGISWEQFKGEEKNR
jgi:transcriptional regulator with XRE-family HTH domain